MDVHFSVGFRVIFPISPKNAIKIERVPNFFDENFQTFFLICILYNNPNFLLNMKLNQLNKF